MGGSTGVPYSGACAMTVTRNGMTYRVSATVMTAIDRLDQLALSAKALAAQATAICELVGAAAPALVRIEADPVTAVRSGIDREALGAAQQALRTAHEQAMNAADTALTAMQTAIQEVVR